MAPKAKEIYQLLFYRQIYYLLTPALESVLSAGLSIRFSSLNFPQQEVLSNYLLLCVFAGQSGAASAKAGREQHPVLSPARLCPSAACTALCTAQAALFGSQPARETQCTRDFHLSNHMGTTSNFLKYHRKKKLYMEICVERVTMISISYKESISTARPCLNNQLCINHSETWDVIKLPRNSEGFISYGIDCLWLINHTCSIQFAWLQRALLSSTRLLYIAEHTLGVHRCMLAPAAFCIQLMLADGCWTRN